MWSSATVMHVRARKSKNMADVPNEPKISVDSNETVLELHKKLKDAIDGKLKEKDWTEDKKEEFRGRILKVLCLFATGQLL